MKHRGHKQHVEWQLLAFPQGTGAICFPCQQAAGPGFEPKFKKYIAIQKDSKFDRVKDLHEDLIKSM